MTFQLPAIPSIRLDHVPDIRLIACDMDGTLLDDDDAIHDDFWPLIDQLHARGILFCPASGRQYHGLLERFRPIADELVFVAENGAYVVQKGIEISSDYLHRQAVHDLIPICRELEAAETDIGTILCGKKAAYVESKNPEVIEELGKSPLRLKRVEDLLAVEDDIFRVAVFSFRSSEQVTYPVFERFRNMHQVVASGEHWLEIMAPQANKGVGIRHIREKLNITRDQTMVFGDFLNDLEMMDEATYSFAMANAHPLLKERANFLCPGNTDNGVVRTIKGVFGID